MSKVSGTRTMIDQQYLIQAFEAYQDNLNQVLAALPDHAKYGDAYDEMLESLDDLTELIHQV